MAEDSSEKCLLESRKIESKIEQRKLLGIRTAMTYDSVQRGRNKFHSKSQGRGRSSSSIRNCKYCGKATTKEIVLPLAKSAKSAVRTTTLKPSVKVVLIDMILANTGPNKKEKGKCSMR